MISVNIRQTAKGQLMVDAIFDRTRRQYLCDWIRDTGTRLELVKWSRNPDGEVRKDLGGKKVEIIVRIFLRGTVDHLKGEKHITKL